MMQENGLGESRVSQVRGFADQQLRKPDAPLDPANRRVSLIVQYVVKPDALTGTTAQATKAPDSKTADTKVVGATAPNAKAPEAKTSARTP